MFVQFNNSTSETKTNYLKKIIQIIEKINRFLPSFPGLARYYDADEDNSTKDIVLVMEYIKALNVRTYLETYGIFDIESTRNIIYQVLHAQPKLTHYDDDLCTFLYNRQTP